MPDYDTTRTTLSSYDAKWKKAGAASYAPLGGLEKVVPGIELVTKPIKIGSVGDVELDERIIGLMIEISAEAREIDRAQYEALMPWFTTGNIPLNPATWHQTMYAYAGPLVLHPNHKSDNTENIILFKAVPKFRPPDRDGVNDDKMIVVFKAFPDQANLNTSGALLLNYGRIGGTDP